MNQKAKQAPSGNKSACPCGSGLAFAKCCGGPVVLPGPKLQTDPRLAQELQLARTALERGQLAGAEQKLRAVLAAAPGHYAGLRLLAALKQRAGDEAAQHALRERLIALYPRDVKVLFDHAQYLNSRGRLKDAEAVLHRLLEIDPRHAGAQNFVGQLVVQNLGTLQKAEYHLRQAVYLQPGVAMYNVKLANVLRTLGRWEEARRFYRIALALDTTNIEALIGLVRIEEAGNNLDAAWQALDIAKRLAPGNPSLEMLAALLHRRGKDFEAALTVLDGIDPQALNLGGRVSWHYDRGQTLDRLGRYAEAFTAFDAANALARTLPQRDYPEAEVTARIERLKGFFTRERLASLPRGTPRSADEPTPIFIVGFPRSGTSMVEQILTAHPHISAGDELILLQRLTERAPQWLDSRQPYPECLNALAEPGRERALARFRDYYLNEIRTMAIVDPGARRFTDKMPLNEMHLGMLALVFPDAPVVHLLRHPLDVLLSCYSNDLRHGEHFAYELTRAAHHYVRVMDLVAHYQRELDLSYLALRYEDLVENIDSGAHKLLDFLGEPWDERCIAFHENQRYARTASYAQVTEQVYTRSVYRYRHYREQLAPVIPIIAPVAERLGYSID